MSAYEVSGTSPPAAPCHLAAAGTSRRSRDLWTSTRSRGVRPRRVWHFDRLRGIWQLPAATKPLPPQPFTRGLESRRRHRASATSTVYEVSGTSPRRGPRRRGPRTTQGTTPVRNLRLTRYRLTRCLTPRGTTSGGSSARAQHARTAQRDSSTTGFRSTPIPEISTSSTSPALSQTGGWRLLPTPPGVPVAITSPGTSSVKVVM